MKIHNRWVYVIAGVIAMMLGGVVYTWSLFSLPIAQEFPQWTQAQLSFTFTVVMLCFSLGNLSIGLLAEKLRRISARIMLLGGAVLFALTFFISARAQTPAVLYVGFGVLGGLMAGVCFNSVLSTVGLWFPDKQGLASGLLLMGFGFSSFFMGKIFQATLPPVVGSWRTSFAVIGAVGAAVLVLCALVIRKPDASFVPPAAKKSKSALPAADVSPLRMVRRRDFFFYFIWLIVSTGAGLVLVAQASGIAIETSALLTGGTLSTVVGLVSVFNGLGRAAVGELFDRCGQNVAMLTVNGTYFLAAVVLFLALQTASVPLVAVGFILGGLGYGGTAPTNSAFLSTRYGMAHYSLNLAICTCNTFVSSFGSTVSGALYDATCSYTATCLMLCAMALVGVAMTAAIILYDKHHQERT